MFAKRFASSLVLAFSLTLIGATALAEDALDESVAVTTEIASQDSESTLIGETTIEDPLVMLAGHSERSTLFRSPRRARHFQAHQPHFFAGTEVTFVQTEAATGGAISLSFNDSNTAGTDLSFRDGNGLTDFGYAPRVWLGYQIGPRWAIVGRYWNLSESESSFPTLTPGTTILPNFATHNETNRVDAHTIDVEAVRSFTPGKWKLDAMVGARHASMSVDSRLFSFGVFTTGNFVNLTLQNGCGFDGTGVTYGLVARRPIGSRHLHWFMSGRGTHIDGHSDSFGRSAGAIASSPSAPLIGAATVTRNNAESMLAIGEAQVGFEWTYAVQCLPVNAFFRSAFEYQSWHIDGPPTGGAGFGGTIGTLTTNSFASAGLGDLEIYGLALSSGFTW